MWGQEDSSQHVNGEVISEGRSKKAPSQWRSLGLEVVIEEEGTSIKVLKRAGTCRKACGILEASKGNGKKREPR